MRVLVIGNDEKEMIKKVVEYSKLYPITREQLLQKTITVGDIKEYTCSIPMGFKVVFSFENQPTGWFRHISISVPDKNRLPSPQAVSMIIEEFGFPKDITDQDNVWIETQSVPNAINVIKKIDDSQLLEILGV